MNKVNNFFKEALWKTLQYSYLVIMKAYYYNDDLGTKIECREIPDDMLETAQKYHDEMVEHVAEQDDALLEKYLEGQELTLDEIKTCIRTVL